MLCIRIQIYKYVLYTNIRTTLSFRNIGGLCSNFVGCESFLESNYPDILALCEANLDDSIDSNNFSVRCYLTLIRKDSSMVSQFS